MIDDKQIIELYRNRDETAIKETQLKYGAYCFTVANHILNNEEDSKECVSDTWMKTWNAIPPQIPEKLKMFLSKITRNISFNKYKALSAEKRGGGELPVVLEELQECLSDKSGTEDSYIAKELSLSINMFISDLKDNECNIFIRRYFFADSIPEISERYGISQNNVTVILSRTRQKLKAHLTKEGYQV